MGEFFNGWRRKVGVLTLVMALAFTSAWVRSNVVREEFVCTFSGRLHAFMSACGSISWVGWSDERIPKSFEWERSWVANQNPSNIRPYGIARSLGMLEKIRFFTWTDEALNSSADDSVSMAIPYRSIVIPLTLLSAYLMLSKPRKSIQKKLADPIPEKVA